MSSQLLPCAMLLSSCAVAPVCAGIVQVDNSVSLRNNVPEGLVVWADSGRVIQVSWGWRQHGVCQDPVSLPLHSRWQVQCTTGGPCSGRLCHGGRQNICASNW